MDSATLLDKARAATDSVSVGRVFGDPVERDGVVLLPVARVTSGGGAGAGSGVPLTKEQRDNLKLTDDAAAPAQEGSGGGFGMNVKPAGVFILKNGEVTWRPALDLNAVILGGQAVAIVALLVAGSVLRRHLKRRR
jgi:uncharacterized spore protein YtfJ